MTGLSNIRLRTNVLCKWLDSPDDDKRIYRSNHDVKQRLSYWELLAWRRIQPNLFDFDRDELTIKQLAERDAFIQPGESDAWSEACLTKFRSFLPISHDAVADDQTVTSFGDQAAQTAKTGANTGPVPVESEVSAIDVVEVNSQEQVITAPPDANLILLAPPGTGKTHALIERVVHLLRSGQFENPNAEILVLTFTRAVNAEIIRRVSQTGHHQTRYANARTFDSYATEILSRVITPEAYSHEGYDRRIEHATQLLSERAHDQEFLDESRLSQLRILIVDEIQDLVGLRAAFVIELIKILYANEGGVLLMGDPAQGIYDYQVAENGGLTSGEFLVRASALLPDCRIIQFVEFHRFSSEPMKRLVASAREAMSNRSGPRLQQLLAELGPPKNVKALLDIPQDGRSTAFLVRRNVDVYDFYDWGTRVGLDVRVERGASGAYWPGWQARLVTGYQGAKMPLEKAQRRWQERVSSHAAIVWEDAVEDLSKMGVITGGNIDIDELTRIVAHGAPLRRIPHGCDGLVVSTIHRSKGLEYDRVFLTQPSDPNWCGNEEETRVVYVAATRAKRELALVEADKGCFRGWRYTSARSEEKWCYRRKSGRYILFFGNDMDISWGMNLLSQQDELWKLFGAGGGKGISFKRDGERCVVTLAGAIIGTATTDVAATIRRITSKPFRACELPIVDLATSIADPGLPGIEQKLGRARLTLTPVVWGEAVLEVDES